MEATYTVTIKPLEPKGDLSFYRVSKQEAAEIQRRWDSRQNIQIGNSYISWQRIAEIEAPPKNLRIEGSKYCGKCENGWKFNGKGAYPCQCNERGKEDVREYFGYLKTQSWYASAEEKEKKKERDEYFGSDPLFGQDDI